jgi:hypothetical protein
LYVLRSRRCGDNIDEETQGADGPVEPPTSYYKSLEDKVEAYAEGIVGGGWLWVRLPFIPILHTIKAHT